MNTNIDYYFSYFFTLPNSFAFSYLSDNVKRFWTTCTRDIRQELAKKYNNKVNNLKGAKHYNIVPVMEKLDDIFDVFSNKTEIWNFLNSRKIILFFDELDTLLTSRLKDVCSSFLSNFRAIKTGFLYVIKSIIGIGTFSILDLN